MRTRRLRAGRARARRGARRSRARSSRRPRRRPARRISSGGLSRRSSSPSTKPNSTCRHVACANARPEPHSCGRSERAGWTRSSTAVPGQVARCSASPASGPRSAGGHRQRRRDVRVRRRRTPRRWRGAAPTPAGLPAAAGGHDPAAEQLGVVVRDAEHAAVERLLRRPHRGGRRARQGAAQGSGGRQGHGPDCNEPVPRRVTKDVSEQPRLRGAHDALHARARDKGVNPLVYWLARAILQPFFHLYFRLSRIGREHVPESGRRHLLRQPPLVPRPVRDRHDHAAADLLRRQAGAVPLPRRRPGSSTRSARSRSIRGAGDQDMLATAKAILERGDAVLDVRRGHAHPPRRARPAQARRRPAGARDRRARRPGRGDRDRGRPQGLAHPPAQGPHPHRQPAHVPQGRAGLAAARRRRDRPHLAQRDAPVGVARRPAAAAPRRRHRRRRVGHRARGRCSTRAGLEVDLGCRTREQAEAAATRATSATCPASSSAGITCCAPPSSSSRATTSSASPCRPARCPPRSPSTRRTCRSRAGVLVLSQAARRRRSARCRPRTSPSAPRAGRSACSAARHAVARSTAVRRSCSPPTPRSAARSPTR